MCKCSSEPDKDLWSQAKVLELWSQTRVQVYCIDSWILTCLRHCGVIVRLQDPRLLSVSVPSLCPDSSILSVFGLQSPCLSPCSLSRSSAPGLSPKSLTDRGSFCLAKIMTVLIPEQLIPIMHNTLITTHFEVQRRVGEAGVALAILRWRWVRGNRRVG